MIEIPEDVIKAATELQDMVDGDPKAYTAFDVAVLAILAEREDKYCQTDQGPILWKDVAQEHFDKLEWQRSSLNPEWERIRLAERDVCAKIAEESGHWKAEITPGMYASPNGSPALWVGLDGQGIADLIRRR